MKITSQKLLLLLDITQEKSLHYTDLPFVWPQLSSSGRRSLLWLLQRQQLVVLKNSPAVIELSERGRQLWKRMLPQKNGLQSDWYLYFQTIQPSKTNEKVHQRLKIGENLPEALKGWLRLAPRVYLGRETQRQELLQHLHAQRDFHHFLVRVGEVEFGDFESVIRDQLAVADLLKLYSGISREVASLILSKNENKTPNNQSKKLFFSVFERFSSSWLINKQALEWSNELFSSGENIRTQLRESWQNLS